MPKKNNQGRGGGNRKKGRSTRTPYRKMKHDQSWARTEKNRRRKRQKHLSLHPRDLQTLAALKKDLTL
jgi:hypothetical protein